MHRCFISSADIRGRELEIAAAAELHHLKDVLRIRPGEKITVCDEKGREYLCSVASVGESIRLRIEKEFTAKRTGIRLTVACAVPKNVKMDDIVDKLTQLGVDRIIPLACARGEVKLNASQAQVKHERWKRIIASAARQCQRNSLTVLEPLMTLEEALEATRDAGLRLIGSLEGERRSLKEAVEKAAGLISCVIFIGPEGDFTPQEVNAAYKAGCVGVSLGELVLRVDTAAVTAAGFIIFYANG